MAPEVRRVPAERTRPLRREVLRPHQTLPELAAEESPAAVFLGVERDGELVAVGSVVPEGPPGSWRVRAMATRPGDRGRGLGTAVLRALIVHARTAGATRVWCSVRVGARRLYEREGFRVESDVFPVERIGPHVLMGRAVPFGTDERPEVTEWRSRS